MTQLRKYGSIEPIQREKPVPNIVVHQHYHQAPGQQRPSHYRPKPMANDHGLAEVARWGAGCITALLAAWILGNAIIHQANSNYWANERQIQRINNHPGGQW